MKSDPTSDCSFWIDPQKVETPTTRAYKEAIDSETSTYNAAPNIVSHPACRMG